MGTPVRLDGRAVVVTGSGRGIGEACAIWAADLGALVVVNDLDPDLAGPVAESIVSRGGVATAHPADISDRDAATGLIRHCIAAYGRIDGLVNNAAVMPLGRLERYDEVRLRRALDVNVVGGFNCAAAALGAMYAQRSGSIVNVTSGAHLGLPEMSEYAASKGAVASMTYAWATEAEGTGVRINAVSPLAATVMSDHAQDYMRRTGATASQVKAPDPSANAPVVCYLLSPAASAVHGQVVRIAGGVLSLMSHPMIAAPSLVRSHWSVDDVDRAFRDLLGARQAPTGLAWIEQLASIEPPPAVDFP